MAMNRGDSACSTGLAKRIYDYWVNDSVNRARSGLATSLTTPQVEMIRSQAWAIAQAVADEVDIQNEPVSLHAYCDYAQSIPSGGYTRINYNNIYQNTHALPVSNVVTGEPNVWKWTAPRAGRYVFYAQCIVLNIAASAEAWMDLYVGTNLLFRGDVFNNQGTTGTNYISKSVFGVTQIAQGAEVHAGLNHTSGGNRVIEGVYRSSYINITRISD